VKFTEQTLLQRLNEDGLWRNPLRLQILSAELGISIIALKGKMNYRRIIRGPYVIDDQQHRQVPRSKRSQVLRSYAELTGDPRSKVRRIAEKFGITERLTLSASLEFRILGSFIKATKYRYSGSPGDFPTCWY